jgi:hypothetical protein
MTIASKASFRERILIGKCQVVETGLFQSLVKEPGKLVSVNVCDNTPKTIGKEFHDGDSEFELLVRNTASKSVF